MCEYLNFLVKKNKQKDFAINSMEKELTYTCHEWKSRVTGLCGK